MPRPRAKKTLGQLDGLSLPSLASIGVTVGVSLWAWFGLVLTEPQDFEWFTAIVAIAHVANGFAQLLVALNPRTPQEPWQGYRVASFVPGFGAMVLTLVGWIATASPSTPVEEFGSGDNVYQVIGVLFILLLGATAAGAGIGGALVVLPYRLIRRAMLGEPARTPRSDVDHQLATLSRIQLLTGAGILVTAVGFAVSMHFVYPDPPGNRIQRIRAQFEALVTFSGEPAGMVGAYAFVLATAALVILHNRRPGQATT